MNLFSSVNLHGSICLKRKKKKQRCRCLTFRPKLMYQINKIYQKFGHCSMLCKTTLQEILKFKWAIFLICIWKLTSRNWDRGYLFFLPSFFVSPERQCNMLFVCERPEECRFFSFFFPERYFCWLVYKTLV